MVDVVVFVVSAIIVLGGALGVVLNSNPVKASLSLVASFFGVAVLFVLKEAHFLALVQVVVYGGAIVVLFLFVIMLLGVDVSENLSMEPIAFQRFAGVAAAVGFLAIILGGLFLSGPGSPDGSVALTGTARRVMPVERDRIEAVESADPTRVGETELVQAPSNVSQIARDLFGRNVLAFEATALLLTIATVGAVVMVKNSSGRESDVVTASLSNEEGLG